MIAQLRDREIAAMPLAVVPETSWWIRYEVALTGLMIIVVTMLVVAS